MFLESVWFTYTPEWLHLLSQNDRQEVEDWIKRAGVDPNLCPGFDYDPVGNLITTRYYEKLDGRPHMNPQGHIAYEDQVREFVPPKDVPRAVKENR